MSHSMLFLLLSEVLGRLFFFRLCAFLNSKSTDFSCLAFELISSGPTRQFLTSPSLMMVLSFSELVGFTLEVPGGLSKLFLLFFVDHSYHVSDAALFDILLVQLVCGEGLSNQPQEVQLNILLGADLEASFLFMQ